MHLPKSAVVVVGLFFHSASATFGRGGWGGDSHYSTPDNTNNKCSPDQTKGYTWDGLASGSFDSYGSNKFSKWSCTNSFGKRDLLTKRSFQSKCISSNLDDEPSIGCEGDDSMSIDKYEVSSSEDAEIECHYEMPDQTICKEYHSCKSGGTVIQNTQCGGAKSVTFKPAKSSKGKRCNIGVHSIGFNCDKASSTPPAVSKTESIPAYGSSSPPVYATTSAETSTEAIPTSSEVVITTDTTPYTSPSSVESVTSTPVESVPSYETASSTSEIATESSPVETTAQSSVPVYDTVSSTVPTASESSPVETTAQSSIPIYDTVSSTAPTASESSPVETTAKSSIPVYDTTSATSFTASETSPVETTAQSVPGYGSSTCVPGYGSSCSTTIETSSPATSRETSPVETSASEYPTSSSPETIAPSSYTTSNGGNIPSYNTSLTYNVPAYTHSASTTVDVTSAESYSSFSTGTIYSTTSEIVTSSGSIATLTKSYAVSTTVVAITSPGKESSPVETSSPSAPTYSGPEPSSPALLPRCLNTWMYLTECSSNSDSNCYCKNSDFINKVYGCLSAWSQSDDNATNGVSYLMGLCAPYIPENPAIVTGCPSTITPVAYTPPAATPTTSTITLESTLTSTATLPDTPGSTEVSPEQTSSPAPTLPAASIPCTTITYSQEVTIPATYASGTSEGSPIPSSTITSSILTTITVPQVQITTYTVTEAGSTITAPGLGYGVPSQTSTADAVAPPTSSLLVMASQTTAAAVPTVYGSAGFTRSPSVYAPAPSGIVPYEGAGVKSSNLGGVILAGMGLFAGMLVL